MASGKLTSVASVGSNFTITNYNLNFDQITLDSGVIVRSDRIDNASGSLILKGTASLEARRLDFSSIDLQGTAQIGSWGFVANKLEGMVTRLLR